MQVLRLAYVSLRMTIVLGGREERFELKLE
jgi:hypothetical protein